MYNENKTSTQLETLQRFKNEAFLKSTLLTNLCYNWWFNDLVTMKDKFKCNEMLHMYLVHMYLVP